MNITVAESRVMDLLWARSPQTSEELIAELAPAQDWSEATIRTLLSRLVKKGMVSTTAEGRRFLYSPQVRREDYLLSESEGLIDRLFEGRVSPFLVQFSARKKLSREDISELRRLIDELDDGD